MRLLVSPFLHLSAARPNSMACASRLRLDSKNGGACILRASASSAGPFGSFFHQRSEPFINSPMRHADNTIPTFGFQGIASFSRSLVAVSYDQRLAVVPAIELT